MLFGKRHGFPTHLKIMIDIATTVYASRTPIESMLTSAARSNKAENVLVKAAAQSVPMTGVWKRGDMIPNFRNINPS